MTFTFSLSDGTVSLVAHDSGQYGSYVGLTCWRVGVLMKLDSEAFR